MALGRAVPKKIAMQMLLTAEPISAEGEWNIISVLRVGTKNKPPLYSSCIVLDMMHALLRDLAFKSVKYM